jgi:hypothetical protein
MNHVIQARGRHAIVEIDVERNQCTVPNTEGGRYFVTGVDDRAARAAAVYAVDHGQSYASAAYARRVLRREADNS